MEDKNEYTYRIRKLTPTETSMLMGMTAADVVKCRDVGMSDSALYKQHGNGLITNCVSLIMEHLYKAEYDENYECLDEKMIADGYGF